MNLKGSKQESRFQPMKDKARLLTPTSETLLAVERRKTFSSLQNSSVSPSVEINKRLLSCNRHKGICAPEWGTKTRCLKEGKQELNKTEHSPKQSWIMNQSNDGEKITQYYGSNDFRKQSFRVHFKSFPAVKQTLTKELTSYRFNGKVLPPYYGENTRLIKEEKRKFNNETEFVRESTLQQHTIVEPEATKPPQPLYHSWTNPHHTTLLCREQPEGFGCLPEGWPILADAKHRAKIWNSLRGDRSTLFM